MTHRFRQWYKMYSTLPVAAILLLILIIVSTGIFFPTQLIWLLLAIIYVSLSVVISYTNIIGMYTLTVLSMMFSLEYTLPDTTATIRLPSEALLIVLCPAWMLRFLRKAPATVSINRNPDIKLILLFFLALSITTFTSTMMVVSLKATIIKVLYILNFYFITRQVLNEFPHVIHTWFNMLSMAMVPVIFYFLSLHSLYDFSKSAAGAVVQPLFKDHTIYSCFLAFLLPYNILQSIHGSAVMKPLQKLYYLAISVIMAGAILVSGCRAAWLSLLVMCILMAIYYVRLNLRWIVVILITIGVYAVMNFDFLIVETKRNRHDSNAATADMITQAQSVTNISSDNSNLERLNRWSCAWRMFGHKPLLGFGPGTYQFQYLDYQLKNEMTPISVTSPYNIGEGRGGTAHNEYLLLLAETGIAGSAFFFALIILTLLRGRIILQNNIPYPEKITTFAMVLGLVTYLVHGFFNNFIETDKTAFLFFVAMAYINHIYNTLNRFKAYAPI